jgi:RimJ/RimL family protein N-acetyltransferase
MDAADFVAYHQPALEADAVRHNLMLAILAEAAVGAQPGLAMWTLGGPGRCALQTPGMPILIGDLDEADCGRLALITAGLDYPGVVGPGLTAQWFADCATALGIAFAEPIPQRIHALSDPPRYPAAPGHARPVSAEDADTFADWMTAFRREATPHDPPPDRDKLAGAAGDGRFSFWVIDGEPVSMAGIVRRTRSTGAIAGVYTPPLQRGRGYAGSVTAAVVERIYAEGKEAACLYTDLRNPYSNRCYARIGFKPVADSLHIVRIASATVTEPEQSNAAHS